MKNIPTGNPGFCKYTDKALAERATAMYQASAILANSSPDIETFNAARLSFLEALEKTSCLPTPNGIAARNAARRLLTCRMAALANYSSLTAPRNAAKPEEPGFFIQAESKPLPSRNKIKKTAVARRDHFLLVFMLIKMVKGVRSYWHG